MITELQDAINVADFTNNTKAKTILLKIAEMPESKQADTLKLVRLLIKNRLTKYLSNNLGKNDINTKKTLDLLIKFKDAFE